MFLNEIRDDNVTSKSYKEDKYYLLKA